MLEVREDLILIDSSYQPAGPCAACGQPIAAGEGYTARFRGRLVRFRCSGCLDSFRREPEHYVSVDDYCCTTVASEESPASEWVI